MLYAGFHVGHQSIVTEVANLVDGERRHRQTGIVCGEIGEFLLDTGQPLAKCRLRPGIERREGTDDA